MKMDFELLYRFFEGLTTEEENKTIKVWLESSPENEKRFYEERKIYDAIILNSNDPDSQTGSISEENEGKSHYRIPMYIKEIVKIAAIVLITVLGSWYFLSNRDVDSNPIAMQTINVPAGQRLNLTLPDGTNVWLNAKTKIQYPVSFNAKERLVTIDGQAYFEVAKNEDVPFIVKSPQGVVQALGTKFDVLDYSDGDRDFQAMLMEGSVKVHLSDNESESVILTPEKKAFLSDGKLDVVQVDDYSVYQWKEGLISFRNESFENIMKSFEKTYDITIIIEDTKIKNLSFTGKFRIIDGVEYALRVLQRDVNFKFERDIDKHIIYIK